MMRIRNRHLGQLYHRLIKKTFPFWERIGLHVTYNHFYEPVPDLRSIPEDFWKRRSELPGIDINDQGQIEILGQFSRSFKSEYSAFPIEATANPEQFYLDNPNFGSVDAEILYCMIRHMRPKRIVEVGSGFSTRLAAQSIRENNNCGSLTVIDPYPNKTVRSLVSRVGRLLEQPIERTPLDEFGDLGENDILFIDSSHVLKTAGDVQYEYLEILPRLRPGVIVHIHDVFLPADYPRHWVMEEHDFWTEQYLLQAFLTFNDRFEVMWGGHHMHLSHPELLDSAFASYNRDRTRPGSFWIRRVN